MVGELLDQIKDEQELGNITSQEQALVLARNLALRKGINNSHPPVTEIIAMNPDAAAKQTA